MSLGPLGNGFSSIEGCQRSIHVKERGRMVPHWRIDATYSGSAGAHNCAIAPFCTLPNQLCCMQDKFIIPCSYSMPHLRQILAQTQHHQFLPGNPGEEVLLQTDADHERHRHEFTGAVPKLPVVLGR
jgi:hypothetical protein